MKYRLLIAVACVFMAVGLVYAADQTDAGVPAEDSDTVNWSDVEPTVARSAYEAFNASLQARDNNMTEEALKHIESGNSLLWVLVQKEQESFYAGAYNKLLMSCMAGNWGPNCRFNLEQIMSELETRATWPSGQPGENQT